MNHETVVSKAKEIADRVLARPAKQNDTDARFSSAPMILGNCEVELGRCRSTRMGLRHASTIWSIIERPPGIALCYACSRARRRQVMSQSRSPRCAEARPFSKYMAVERLLRDAHAGAVMGPTGDVVRDFIGKAVLGIPLF